MFISIMCVCVRARARLCVRACARMNVGQMRQHERQGASFLALLATHSLEVRHVLCGACSYVCGAWSYVCQMFVRQGFRV